MRESERGRHSRVRALDGCVCVREFLYIGCVYGSRVRVLDWWVCMSGSYTHIGCVYGSRVRVLDG